MSASRAAPVGLVVLLAFLLAACASSGTAAGRSNTHHDIVVSISGYKFLPATLKVSPGDTVVWTNQDADNHTVTSDQGTTMAFDSSTLAKRKSFRATFTKAGTYHYHCAYHSFMTGTVKVGT